MTCVIFRVYAYMYVCMFVCIHCSLCQDDVGEVQSVCMYVYTVCTHMYVCKDKYLVHCGLCRDDVRDVRRARSKQPSSSARDLVREYTHRVWVWENKVLSCVMCAQRCVVLYVHVSKQPSTGARNLVSEYVHRVWVWETKVLSCVMCAIWCVLLHLWYLCIKQLAVSDWTSDPEVVVLYIHTYIHTYISVIQR
jgi:hypothetical protein